LVYKRRQLGLIFKAIFGADKLDWFEAAFPFSILFRLIEMNTLIASLLASSVIAQNALPIAWGAATSAYQIEGGFDKDGKDPSIWDAWFADPVRNGKGPNGNIAADHYTQYKDDLKFLGEMGATAYRFSISWPRVIKDCNGEVNEAGMQFYSDMIDEIIKNGALPVMTLYHWDVPQSCHDKYKSWLDPQIVKDFTYYSEKVLDRFQDRLEYVLTLNEPAAQCGWGYGRMGSSSDDAVVPIVFPDVWNADNPDYSDINNQLKWPPGITFNDRKEADRSKRLCLHHKNLAHASVVKMARKKYGADKFKFGMPLIIAYGMPFDARNQSDIDATERFHLAQVDQNWGPMTSADGDYPAMLKENPYWGPLLPTFTEEEKSTMLNSLDFVAFNYYSASYVKNVVPSKDKTWGVDYIVEGVEAGNVNSEGTIIPQIAETSWQYTYPEGLAPLSKWLHDTYKMDIWITECGTSVKGEKDKSLVEIVNDVDRVNFFTGITESLTKAVNDGIPIKAFLGWSLLDNFEWMTYNQRFGLVSIERGDDQSTNNSLKRSVKDSFRFLQNFFKDSKSPFVLPKPSDGKTLTITKKTGSASSMNITNWLYLCIGLIRLI
jgi:beta-glucosidase